MTDAELWQACVESGFVASEWWPRRTPHRTGSDPLTWVGDSWAYKGIVGVDFLAARALILASLVEWATKDGRRIDYMDSGSTDVACFGEAIAREGEPTLALLACYRQWKENA